MERRTFLKGAALAAATPAVALSPVIVVSLGHLIGQHTALEELFKSADDQAMEIHKDPSRPTYPHIYAHEFGPYRSGIPTREQAYFAECDIIALFDRERSYADLNKGHWTPEQRAKIVADADDRQRRALELYELRKAIYDEWRRSSGYDAATAERGRLGSLISGLEADIASYRPGTLDDVRSKASFFNSIYGSEPPQDIIEAFVNSLIT